MSVLLACHGYTAKVIEDDYEEEDEGDEDYEDEDEDDEEDEEEKDADDHIPYHLRGDFKYYFADFVPPL